MTRLSVFVSAVFAVVTIVLVMGAVTLPQPVDLIPDGDGRGADLRSDADRLKSSDSAAPERPRWEPPSVDAPWTFDLFTPPAVVRNAETGGFALMTLESPMVEEGDDIELLAVMPPTVRLQLVGYVGERGNWRGVFEDRLTGETHLARAGQHLLGWRVKDVRVQQNPELRPDNMPLSQWLADAELEDVTSGEILRLTNEAPATAAPPRARLRFKPTQDVWEQAVGTERVFGAAVVRLTAVQIEPPAAEVVLGTGDAVSAPRWITPLTR